MKLPPAWQRLLQKFSLGVIIQAVLSGSNFIVGLILIRRTNDEQYSYYVLATNALLLMVVIQNAIVQPYTVTRLTRLEQPQQRKLIGSLMWTRQHVFPVIGVVGLLLTLGARVLHLVDTLQAVLIGISLLAGGISLGREFLRMVLFSYHRPREVLFGDLWYVGLLLVGAMLATLTPQPALVAILTLGLAALMARIVLQRQLWRAEPWDTGGHENLLRALLVSGSWSVSGAAIHWLLIQGYGYLVAGMLSLQDVAEVAASRLTMMPVFVLSGGVSMLLYPVTARWLHQKGIHSTIRRLSGITVGLMVLALGYMGVMWWARDWVFTVILHKHLPHRDALLLLWGAVFIVTLCRDQMATLLFSRERFRSLTIATAFSVSIWVVASYLGIQAFGPAGSVVGILIGELTNLLGIVFLIRAETRRPVPVPVS